MDTQEMMEDVSLGLVENSLDFIEKGLGSIIDDDEKESKYAVLHLFSGILLFFKDIIYKEHWTLIFQNVDEANKTKLKNGDIKSVNFHTLLKRLNNSERIWLTEELMKDLEWVQKERNKIEHFHSNINTHEVKSRIASLLNNLIILIRKHKESDKDYSIEYSQEHIYEYESVLEIIQDYSFKFKDFVEKRRLIIKKEIEKSSIVIDCPICKQKSVALIPEENLAKCHFCLNETTLEMFYHKNTPVSIEELYYMNTEEEYNCPECAGNKLYETQDDDICFDCFARFDKNDLINCPRCNVTIESPDGRIEFCESCMEYIMSQ